MYVPRTHQGFHVPQSLVTFLMAVTAITATIVAWAVFDARPTGTDHNSVASFPSDPTTIRTIAYSEPADGYDHIYVRSAATSADPVRIASFPYVFNFHARGSASPDGERLAVLHVSNFPGTFARLTLLHLPSGEQRGVEAEFEYLSNLVWSSSSTQVAGVGYSHPDDAGRVDARIQQVNVVTGHTMVAATFNGVIEVQPVGFSADGARLFMVVVDQSGSTLWAAQNGRVERVGSMSQGRTRDWSLSPDGSRLAYIDVRTGGERTSMGHTMLVSTGDVVRSAGEGEQLGSAWQPGAAVVDFGGPGGSVHLTSTEGDAAYVVPIRWSPDGTILAARIASKDPTSSTSWAGSLELATAESRILLSSRPGAWLFGWVRNHE